MTDDQQEQRYIKIDRGIVLASTWEFYMSKVKLLSMDM